MSTHLETILTSLDLGEFIERFQAEALDDGLLALLTDDDLQKLGIDKLGHRKRLLAAFAAFRPIAPVALGLPKMDPAAATRDLPFVDGLGLPFVPIPGHATLFCIWPLRRCDYHAYCQETGVPAPPCDFAQGPDHPVVNVTWHDAMAFCRWLTNQERDRGLITPAVIYRLPEDWEWSAAVGLPAEIGRTPADRSGKIRHYPWGTDFPPPRHAGNYHPSRQVDEFRETSPVGSFPANPQGIHDLGGNVWEWCRDDYDRESDRRVLRGASCFNDDDEYLLSSFRDKLAPGSRRNNTGFRVVLAPIYERDHWF